MVPASLESLQNTEAFTAVFRSVRRRGTTTRRYRRAQLTSAYIHWLQKGSHGVAIYVVGFDEPKSRLTQGQHRL
jgi:hypothetical protein